MPCYELRIEADDGAFLVTAPQFPEVTSFGEDIKAARRHGLDAIEEAIAARIASAQGIPLPLDKPRAKGHFVELPALTLLKISLYECCRDRGVTRAELARRLHWHREQVDRLFRLDHRSRLDQLEAAFAAIGVRLRVTLDKAEAA